MSFIIKKMKLFFLLKLWAYFCYNNNSATIFSHEHEYFLPPKICNSIQRSEMGNFFTHCQGVFYCSLHCSAYCLNSGTRHHNHTNMVLNCGSWCNYNCDIKVFDDLLDYIAIVIMWYQLYLSLFFTRDEEFKLGYLKLQKANWSSIP